MDRMRRTEFRSGLKKFLFRAAAFVLCLSILCACSGKGKKPGPAGSADINTGELLQNSNGNLGQSGTVTPVGDLMGDTGYRAPSAEEETAKKTDSSGRAELEDERLAFGISPDTVALVCEEQEGRYFYDHMDAAEHALYAEIIMILKGHGENILVSAGNPEQINKAFYCVFQDHPEIFWVSGYSYRKYTNGSDTYFSFTGKYTYTESECEAFQSGIDQYTSECLGGLSKFSTQYEKVKYVYEYVIKHTDYDLSAPDNQNILSVFLKGKSVCQGYAKAVQYLLERAGVPCTLVVGTVTGNEGHAWNLVNIDGAYYYLDATWGDSGYQRSSGEKSVPGREVSYDFLNVTDEELFKTHTPDNVLPMPQCTAINANYYVKEGLFFDSYNEQSLYVIFHQAQSGGKHYAAVKCADPETYKLFCDSLIGNRRIFELLNKDTESVDYVTNDSQYILCFMF